MTHHIELRLQSKWVLKQGKFSMTKRALVEISQNSLFAYTFLITVSILLLIKLYNNMLLA